LQVLEQLITSENNSNNLKLKKMNKGQVIGLVVTGLAVVGGIAVFNYFRKPRVNSEGFFNATGMSPFFQQTSDRNKDNFSNMTGTGC